MPSLEKLRDQPRFHARFPDFVGIGAQKAGTTWIYANFRRHPSVWLPPVKELQFFNELYIPEHRKWTPQHRRQGGIRALKQHLNKVPEADWEYRYIGRVSDIIEGPISDEWYGSIFGLARNEQVCGEITPEYSLLPEEGIRHLLRLAPDVRVIFSLRDPIERNWSHVRMLSKRRGISEVKELQRLAARADVVERSNYPKIIDRWLGHLPPDRFLTIFMDDIIARPTVVARSICAFLNIEFDQRYFPSLRKPIHVGEPIAIPEQTYELMKRQLRPIYLEMERRYPDLVKPWISKHF